MRARNSALCSTAGDSVAAGDTVAAGDAVAASDSAVGTDRLTAHLGSLQ